MQEGVIGITFNSDKKEVLVVQRRDVAVWALPGGGIDRGETPEEAVIREVEEETGIKVTIQRKVAELKPLNRLGGLTHIYECTKIRGTSNASTEARNCGFYPVDRLPELFFFIQKDWIDLALEEKEGMVEGTIDQLTYPGLLKFFLKHPFHTLRFLAAKMGFPINSHSS